MMIAPVIFCTVVHGIASMSDLKKVGRIGVKTLFYFEAVSTLALAIGLIVGEIIQPGKGFNIDPATLDPKLVASYVTRAKEEGIVAHLMAIIPDSFFGALARGDLLQVLLVSILSGFAISRLGELGEKINARDRQRRQDVLRHHRASSCGPRRSARSAPWRSPSAPTASARWSISLALIATFYLTSIAVRAGRARHHRAICRLFDPALPRLHQGRTADRARHRLVGNGAAAHDPEDGASRRVEVGGRPGDPDRLQLQPRRHQHLHDAGDAVPGAGHQHAARPSARSSASWWSP